MFYSFTILVGIFRFGEEDSLNTLNHKKKRRFKLPTLISLRENLPVIMGSAQILELPYSQIFMAETN